MSDSVAVDAAAPLTFGGDVSTVLESPRSTMPPPTLEEARNQPGRHERIEAITKLIEAQGIKYVFFQQVSERGYQLVYGATANLFTDRAGDYIGFGPEESELAAIADLDTFAPLPWDPRVARVLCDCYDTESGELLDADPRQNLKRVVSEFEQELGYSFLIGIEPEMMWLKRPEDGGAPDGVTKLSETARHFLGGMLDHFGALMCVGNPTVNSYCRMWDFGFWAPVYKNWGWQNRTCTVRVASGGRFEYRGVDSSCNPYLTVAALLVAGLDGIKNQSDPGEPQSRNTYDILAEQASNGSGPRLERVPDS